MKLTCWLPGLARWLLWPLAAQAQAIEVRSPAEQEIGEFGYRVLAISDITGDGTPELAVTGFVWPTPTRPRGAVFVLNGRDFSQVSRSDPPYPSSHPFADSGSFGWSLAEAPDVNGDGVRDLIIGAVYAARLEQGRTRLCVSSLPFLPVGFCGR